MTDTADSLIEAIYDAALDPAGWTHVMAGLRSCFRTSAETMYFLDYRGRTERHFHIEGIAPRFQANFETLFYTPDNPCIITPHLHRPGRVRTDEITSRHAGRADALRRSTYFNEWMRPQGFARSLGSTPLADGTWVLNLSLFRSEREGRFTAAEQRRFARLSGHFRRAARIVRRFDTLAAGPALISGALDRLAQGVLLLATDGTILHANRAAEVLLRRGGALRPIAGRLTLADPDAQAALEHLLSAPAGSAPLLLNIGDHRLVLSAAPVSAAPGLLGPGRRAVLLLLNTPNALPAPVTDLLARLHGFNSTESRLAEALLAGETLRDAARRACVTYETARWNLKIMFQKTATARQAELVARLLADVTAAGQLDSTLA